MSMEPVSISSDDLILEELIGSGRSADVFRGSYEGNLVSVKQLRSSRGPDAAAQLGELSRELSILQGLSKLSHPHLVHFIGHTDQEPLRLVTEFCGGGTLHDMLHFCDHINLSWEQRLLMLAQVADAMMYLHGASPRVIHRDLKSPNLLLADPVYSESDRPIMKVADFGLARFITEDECDAPNRLTRDVGTQIWKAPEMFLGSDYNEKVDNYSFGMIIYEVACRALPFEDLTQQDFGAYIVQGVRPDPADMTNESCPEELVVLAQQCWAQDPVDRPSFSAIVSVLNAINFPGRSLAI